MLNKKQSLLFLCLLMLLVCCKQRQAKTKQNNPDNDYAVGFRIEHKMEYKVLTIYDKGLSYVFELGKKKSGSTVSVPVKKVICLSATQVTGLKRLNAIQTICAISDIKYQKDEMIKEKVKKGEIQEVLVGNEMNMETVLHIKPDIILSSFISKQEQLIQSKYKIHVIPYLDYLENHPLGRAEWIKVLGLLMNKEKEADSIFNHIKQLYENESNSIAENSRKPTIFSALPEKEIWMIPGGKSYLATLFHDAGCKYVYAKDDHAGTLTYDFERVYKDVLHADNWFIVSYHPNRFSLEQLIQQNPLFSHLDAVKNKQIVYCNTAKVSYFEESCLEPEVLLRELYMLTHPDENSNMAYKYFRMLE